MSDPSDLYKIGTVAKLTGIAVERLRAWERRYGLTPASKEGKTRYFSAEQVEQLTRIKRLIDSGHPVSTLINLDSDALAERLQQIQPSAAPKVPATAPRVGLVGTQLLMLEQSLSEPPRVTIAGRWVNTSQALTELTTTGAGERPTLLVTLLGSLTPEKLAELDVIAPDTQPLIVYHYATESGLAEAAERHWETLRWPASWSDIEQAIARTSRSPLRAGKRAGRRFSDEQLLTIASSGSALGCACPADLVNLISALNAFSDHTAACATPTEQHPVPHNAVHHEHHTQIAERTSAARLELELVLEEWINANDTLATT